MVDKVVDVATIPNAGQLRVPEYENVNQELRNLIDNNARPDTIWESALRMPPVSVQAAIEHARIPAYLGAGNRARARFILDYENWDTINHWAVDSFDPGDDSQAAPITHLHVAQRYPLWAPMHRAFWAADHRDLHGDAYIESHYPLYLVDMDW